jgi:hypothetical protein
VIHAAGDCPVGVSEVYHVIDSAGERSVFVYCPDCGAVWRNYEASETEPYLGLADIELSERAIRYATVEEIAAAGLSIGASYPKPWYELPRLESDG